MHLEGPVWYSPLRVGAECVIQHAVHVFPTRVSNVIMSHSMRPQHSASARTTHPKMSEIIAALPGLSTETADQVYR